MIFNIRGPSGSGKSTLVRRIMELYPTKFRHMAEGRRQPIGYVFSGAIGSRKKLAVIGHYETACGGCDTIQGMDKIFNLVRKADDAGHDVIFESLIMVAETRRMVDLASEGRDVKLIRLTTPVDVCVESVRKRRADTAAAKNRQPKPEGANFIKNIESKFRYAERAAQKLEPVLDVLHLDREEAYKHIANTLNLTEA